LAFHASRIEGLMMKHLLWLVPSIAIMAWLESQWPAMALWSFVALALTIGFAHGAMDVWLLMDAQPRAALRSFGAYGLCVALLAAALLPFPGVALVALLLLSVWHFGEQALTLLIDAKIAHLLRVVQGGASVMLPVLFSAAPLQATVQKIAPLSSAWVWPVWVALASLWLALLIAAIAVVQPWRASAKDLMKHTAMRTLMGELAILVLLNALLSPLLAFALFFGLYHSGMHLRRMFFIQRHREAWHWVMLGLALVITWAALAWLWWRMPAPSLASFEEGAALRWLVVALAAVTLPHMVLVSRQRERLFSAR
jgi:beta-carotene 15,15'-dioxygenase